MAVVAEGAIVVPDQDVIIKFVVIEARAAGVHARPRDRRRLEEIMAFSLSNVRLNGCLFGPPSDRDYRTVFRTRSVPDRVNLRPYCTAVENQGTIGSCTAIAAVGGLEYHYTRRDGRSPGAGGVRLSHRGHVRG